MSMKIASLVVDHGPRDPGEFAVLLVLADRADNDTWVCWPSRADLVERSRLSYATIGRKLRALERAGWIARRKRFNSSSVFRVNVPRLLQAATAREKVRIIPEGFEPFAEELQHVEIKGNDHSDRSADHCDRSADHQDRLNLSKTSKEPLRARQVRRAPPLPALGQAARGSVEPITTDLSAFQAARVRADQSIMLGGVLVLPGSLEMAALRQALRGQGAESEGCM